MKLGHMVWAAVIAFAVYMIATTYGAGYLASERATWALAEAARLQAETNLVSAETLRAVIRQQMIYNYLIIIGLSLALWASLSQRVVYVPRGKG